MQEERRFPTETRYQLLRGVLIGVLGLLSIAFIFPQPAVSTLSHQVLHLPRPGAGIGLIYGPVICLLLHLGRLWGGERWGTASAAVGAAVSSLLTGGKAPPAVGASILLPPLGILICGVILETINRFVPKPQISLPLAGALGNVALMCYYWLVIFPGSKGWVRLDALPGLLLIGVVSGSVLGGLLPMLLVRFLSISHRSQ
jgi:hypothetical protein